MKEEIDKLRDDLHREMESEDKNHKEILRLSEKLDYLIVEFHKDHMNQE